MIGVATRAMPDSDASLMVDSLNNAAEIEHSIWFWKNRLWKLVSHTRDAVTRQ